jgi:putative transposase
MIKDFRMVFQIRRFDPKKHHRQSYRIKGYDFSQPGSYFITIKTYLNQHTFGIIKDKTMILNKNGIIVYNEWIKTSFMRPNIISGQFIIMPDHIHGIIIIVNRDTMYKNKNDVF